MTTPESGYATFETAFSHETFGGHIDKQSRGNVAVVNPKTDVSAEQYVDLCRTAAHSQWVQPFAVFSLTIGTSTGTSSINYYKGQNGSGTLYKPAISWTSTGRLRVTWDATYTDEYSVVGTVALTMADGRPTGSTFLATTCSIVSSSVIDVFHWDAAGSALASRTSIITVHTMGA